MGLDRARHHRAPGRIHHGVPGVQVGVVPRPDLDHAVALDDDLPGCRRRSRSVEDQPAREDLTTRYWLALFSHGESDYLN